MVIILDASIFVFTLQVVCFFVAFAISVKMVGHLLQLKPITESKLKLEFELETEGVLKLK